MIDLLKFYQRNKKTAPSRSCFDAILAQEVEHRRGKEEVPSSNLGNGFVFMAVILLKRLRNSDTEFRGFLRI